MTALLLASAAFGLGRWSKIQDLRPPVTVESYKVENEVLGKLVVPTPAGIIP